MITRIVRMSFQPERVQDFEAIFEASKTKIRNFEGCLYLSLHRDHHHSNVYYTLSHWESQMSLDLYRNSPLFKSTWSRTKELFDEQPLAFSLDEMIRLQ